MLEIGPVRLFSPCAFPFLLDTGGASIGSLSAVFALSGDCDNMRGLVLDFNSWCLLSSLTTGSGEARSGDGALDSIR